MLNRRNARIKVMQLLYSQWQSEELDARTLQAPLMQSFEQSYHLYLYCLLCLREVALYAETYAEIKASKLLPTDEDKFVSTRLAHCHAVRFLNEDERFLKLIKKARLNLLKDDDMPRRLFRILAETDMYKTFINETATHRPADEEVLSYLFREVMVNDELFDQHLEQHFPCWLDERDTVLFAVNITLQHLSRMSFHAHEEYVDKMGESQAFGNELLNKTIRHLDETKALIEPTLRNWDMERVAIMDVLLMAMCLTEVLAFPTIPVKVSINEYIDISKIYSTPKSKEFINGVLDRVVRDLKSKNAIFKEGRGLVNE